MSNARIHTPSHLESAAVASAANQQASANGMRQDEMGKRAVVRQRPLTKAEHDRRLKFSHVAVTHGKSRTPEHNAWLQMRQRCNYPAHPEYFRYGARGIKVCEEWDSFEKFASDMGPRPPKGTLERLDNEKGYSPDNCAWRTQAEQLRNTRRTIKVTRDGVTLCLKDWCTKLGLKYRTISGRIYTGWTIEEAFAEPIRTKFRNKLAKTI